MNIPHQTPPIALPLPAKESVFAANEALQFATGNGILMRNKANQLKAAPFTLTPSPVPRALFEQVRRLTPAFQQLKHRAVNDATFLKEALKHAAEEDAFTRNLLTTLERAQTHGIRQSKTLLISRSDYMLHQTKQSDAMVLQQVEMNMISCSFANLCPKVADMHRFLIKNVPALNKAYNQDQLLSNTSNEKVALGLVDAFKAYNNNNAVLLMVVQPGEKNSYDQRFFDFYLEKNFSIVVRRYSLKEINDLGNVNENGALFMNDEEIAVAYFRAGYTPNDYPSEDEWNARFILETSMPIKCPSIALQLSGLKKIQQVLARDDVMKKFVDDEKTRVEMQSLFAGLWSLGDDSKEEQELIQKAIETNCESVVLKPQREGGGNNLYGDDATKLLKSMSVKERRAYILMSLIVTPRHATCIVRDTDDQSKQVELVEGVSELGIYGTMLADGNQILHNREAGYLLRTKSAEHKDGGVAAGVAVLDSIYFV